MNELYKLECFRCGTTVEVPTTERSCPHCNQQFEIDWHGGAREYEARSEERGERTA